MKRNLVTAALVAVAIVTSVLPAAAQTSAAGVVQRNGYCFNATTGQIVDCTTGQVIVIDGSRDRDYGQFVSTGITSIALAAGKSVQTPEAIDVSTFSKLTMFVTWTMAAAADSDSVNIGIRLYGKMSYTMGDGINAPLMSRITANSVADTARIWYPTGVAASITAFTPPSFYITRNSTTGLNITGVAYNHGASVVTALGPRLIWAGNGCAIIDLGNLVDRASYPYIGFDISNYNVTKSLTSCTAYLWGSR